MDRYTAIGILAVSAKSHHNHQPSSSSPNLHQHSLLLQHLEPLVDDVGRRKSAIFISQVANFNACALENVFLVVWLADANHRRHIVLLQLLWEEKNNFENFSPWKRSSTSKANTFLCVRRDQVTEKTADKRICLGFYQGRFWGFWNFVYFKDLFMIQQNLRLLIWFGNVRKWRHVIFWTPRKEHDVIFKCSQSSQSLKLTIKYDWIVASDGLSVMRNFMPLNSMRAGAGRISFCLMLIVVIKPKTLEKSGKLKTLFALLLLCSRSSTTNPKLFYSQLLRFFRWKA